MWYRVKMRSVMGEKKNLKSQRQGQREWSLRRGCSIKQERQWWTHWAVDVGSRTQRNVRNFLTILGFSVLHSTPSPLENPLHILQIEYFSWPAGVERSPKQKMSTRVYHFPLVCFNTEFWWILKNENLWVLSKVS